MFDEYEASDVGNYDDLGGDLYCSQSEIDNAINTLIN
jgi:hypothetical protein